MAKRLFLLTYRAEAAVNPYTIVKAGTVADYDMLPAAAASDVFIGIKADLDSQINELGDVSAYGVELLQLGGVVTRGQQLTSDANGHGVAAAAGNNVIGVAQQSGVLGDLIDVLITLGGIAHA
jgi:hypothetical protein